MLIVSSSASWTVVPGPGGVEGVGVVVVVWPVKDGSSTVMLLMTLFTPLSNKKSCPEKMFIIVVLRCRDQPEEKAPGGHMWLTTGRVRRVEGNIVIK